MSEEFLDVIKQGPVKIKGKRLGMMKSQWLQLYSASSKGPVRLEKYSSREAAQQSVDDTHKPIYLTKIQSVKRATLDRKQAIEISFSSSEMPSFVFIPDNDTEADSWCKVLEQVLIMLTSENEYNQNTLFNVYLLPTPNLSAHGECLLQVTSKEVSLYDSNDSTRRITRWPLSSLRRFGREGSKFTIESGRSSPTGEGIFVFNSWQNEPIYQTVHRSSTTVAESVRIARTTSDRSAEGPAVPQRPANISLSSNPPAPAPPSPPGGRRLSLDSGMRGPLPALPGKKLTSVVLQAAVATCDNQSNVALSEKLVFMPIVPYVDSITAMHLSRGLTRSVNNLGRLVPVIKCRYRKLLLLTLYLLTFCTVAYT